QAAELPIGLNESVDEEALERCGGLELLVVTGGEGFEFGGIFAGDHLGFGSDAGFEGIESGDGVALRSARARRLLRIATIRFDLTKSCHFFVYRLATGRGEGD